MNKIRISIIIPVYNVEMYLERCLLSILTQDISTEQYQLLVVNDGSTDGSREILRKLQEQYPIINIIDKENGGLSSARNEGLKHATGDYIFFLDSDDWIAKGSLLFLMKWIEKSPVDILLFGICEVYDSGKRNKLTSSLSANDEVVNIDCYLSDFTVRSSAWQGLFSRKLFIKSNYQFKDGFVSEDDDFVVRIFSIAEQICCNNHTLYYYYQRSNSISKGKAFEKQMIHDKLIMLEELDQYIAPFQGKLKKGLQRKLDFLAVDIIRLLIRKNHSSALIDESLSQLKKMGYFPLHKQRYSLKYTLFRNLLSNKLAVKMARRFKKRF